MRAQRYAASDRAVKGGHAGTVEGIAAVGLALTLACSQVWMRYVNRDGKTAVTGVHDFFFQAGDGIRDLAVTGVQTCALPIYADLSIETKESRLAIRGEKQANDEEKTGDVLYQGIAGRAFERSFQLADYVEVKGASLDRKSVV